MVRRRVLKEISAWSLVALGLAAVGATTLVMTSGCQVNLAATDAIVFLALLGSGAICLVLGRLLNAFRPENPIGWLLAILGLILPMSPGLLIAGRCAPASEEAFSLAGISFWLMMSLSTISVLIMFVLIPVLFPTGTFISRRWKAVVWTALAIPLLLTLLIVITPGPMTLNGIVGATPLENPFSLPLPWLRNFERFLYASLPQSVVIAGLIGIAAFITRFRRSTGDERQQLKWFAYFLATVVTVHLIGFEFVGGLLYPELLTHWSYGLIVFVSFSGFPLVIGLAVVKYRLYDIDLIIRRTLVYGLVTAALALVYFITVTVLQALFTAISGQQSTVAIVLSTITIAALFNPVRRSIQAFIDRRFYRSKYNAGQVLDKFSASVRNQTTFDSIVVQLQSSTQDAIQPEFIELMLLGGVKGKR